jgi:hypothetical protein
MKIHVTRLYNTPYGNSLVFDTMPFRDENRLNLRRLVRNAAANQNKPLEVTKKTAPCRGTSHFETQNHQRPVDRSTLRADIVARHNPGSFLRYCQEISLQQHRTVEIVALRTKDFRFERLCDSAIA